MKCTKCDSTRSSVVDSRSGADNIRRRRECLECNNRFTTYERIEATLPMLIKKDGRREPFDSAKVRVGVVKACEKRPISVETIDKVLMDIEAKLVAFDEKEVPSDKVGEFVMEALREVDQVAYVRFASVYREFSDISQFVEALQVLKKQTEGK